MRSNRIILQIAAIFSAFAIQLMLASGAYADLQFKAGSTDDGLRFIVVTGKFEYADSFDTFSDLVRSHRPVVVLFNSDGGNVFKAMEFGRLIRRNELDTIMVDRLRCVSACVMAFLGGVNRLAVAGSIGVHMTSFDKRFSNDPNEMLSGMQKFIATMMAHVTEMGANAGLIKLALETDADDMRYLSQLEMGRLGVTTAQRMKPQPKIAEPYRVPLPNTPSSERIPNLPSTNVGVPRLPAPNFNVPDLAPSNFVIPKAVSGRVRHPKGTAPLKSFADKDSDDIATLPNRTQVVIIESDGDWYGIRSANVTGFMHHSWVLVDQYQQVQFEDRYIQVKSLSDFGGVNAYVRSSAVPLAAFLSTNGWFAITMNRTLDRELASQLMKDLKADSKIPEDSFVTYGNTYTKRVCCN